MNSIKDTKIKYFLYRRKSTDDDRQVLSLESQEEEVLKRFGNLKIIKLPPESVSAFKPERRPIFNNMIERIKKGEAQGIMAWHPDRLSRNPIDSAQIIYLLDTGELKDLKFCSYTFENSPDGKFFLTGVMSQSKHSSDKLSVDVKRGMDKKAQMGERPGRATLGYKNSRTGIRGEQVIYKDDLRFSTTKQMWRMLLSGNYSVPAILDIANRELKITMPATRKRPERKLQQSALYKVFTNPFYYGWYEWPKGSDNWIKGNQEAMITEEEFDIAQEILGRKGRPRPQKHKFAFTGLMECGSCGGSVTAEEKWKHQKNGNIHHYIFYHCTKKKKNIKCPEKWINLDDFNNQVDDVLARLTISDKFKDWAIRHLHEIRKDQAKTNEEIVIAKHRKYESVQKQIDNLLLKYSSPDNSENQLITNEEYAKLRSTLLKEKNELEAELSATGNEIEKWLELSEKTFNFACYARKWFANGDLKTKRAIFACLGSHLILKDKKIIIQLKKPFKVIFDGLIKHEAQLGRLEPVQMGKNSFILGISTIEIPLLSE